MKKLEKMLKQKPTAGDSDKSEIDYDDAKLKRDVFIVMENTLRMLL